MVVAAGSACALGLVRLLPVQPNDMASAVFEPVTSPLFDMIDDAVRDYMAVPSAELVRVEITATDGSLAGTLGPVTHPRISRLRAPGVSADDAYTAAKIEFL